MSRKFDVPRSDDEPAKVGEAVTIKGEHTIDLGEGPLVGFYTGDIHTLGSSGYGVRRDPETSRWYRYGFRTELIDGEVVTHRTEEYEIEGPFYE